MVHKKIDRLVITDTFGHAHISAGVGAGGEPGSGGGLTYDV